MKKILSTAAVFVAATAMLSASAFASCPLNTHKACTGKMTGAAAPVSYIIAPVQERAYVPSCNTCAKKTQKTFFQKVTTPFTGIYNTIFSPFTNLYD